MPERNPDTKALEPLSVQLDNILVCPDDVTLIGRAEACKGCPGQSLCMNANSKGIAEAEKLEVRMKVIKHKIVIMSGKGGVGKSTVAWQLALKLSQLGNKVGVLDLDLCGPSIPKLFNCEQGTIINTPWGWTPVNAHGIVLMSISYLSSNRDNPVIWRGPRKTNMVIKFLRDTYWGRLDYLIIDTPPGTSDEHLSVIAGLKNANPDGCIIVTTPQDLVIDVIRRQINFCQKLKLPILGIIENMSGFNCPCCGELYPMFPGDKMKQLIEEFKFNLLGQIPLDSKLASCADQGDASECGKEFIQVAEKIQCLVEERK